MGDENNPISHDQAAAQLIQEVSGMVKKKDRLRGIIDKGLDYALIVGLAGGSGALIDHRIAQNSCNLSPPRAEAGQGDISMPSIRAYDPGRGTPRTVVSDAAPSTILGLPEPENRQSDR
jgi:hypothetical protein